jgi:hypothetical protein
MGASSAQREGCSPLKDAGELLEQALAILDANNGPADIGAMLQEVIDRLKEIESA